MGRVARGGRPDPGHARYAGYGGHPEHAGHSHAAESHVVERLSWQTDEQTAVALAREKRKPMLLVFCAEWSPECKTLDRRALSDADVKEVGGRFVAVRIDCSDDTSAVEALKTKYRVQGVPTLIVFSRSGSESKRFTEVVSGEILARALSEVD